MTSPADDVRAENESRSGAAGVGCLTWTPGAVVVGALLSFFSVAWSVHFDSPGIITIGPSGFVAGFPVTFVEFDGTKLDANDPPSTIFGLNALGGSVSEVSWTLAVLNIFPWVICTLVVAAVLRWRLRSPT